MERKNSHNNYAARAMEDGYCAGIYCTVMERRDCWHWSRWCCSQESMSPTLAVLSCCSKRERDSISTSCV